MAQDESTQQTQDIPAVIEQAERSEPSAQSPWEAQAAAESPGDNTLPLAGAAFVSGLVLARILKKVGGGEG